jgi:hypothetical protein
MGWQQTTDKNINTIENHTFSTWVLNETRLSFVSRDKKKILIIIIMNTMKMRFAHRKPQLMRSATIDDTHKVVCQRVFTLVIVTAARESRPDKRKSR